VRQRIEEIAGAPEILAAIAEEHVEHWAALGYTFFRRVTPPK
jgi:hypothetical protein